MCRLIWRLKFPDSTNCLLQTSHVYRRSLLWYRRWTYKNGDKLIINSCLIINGKIFVPSIIINIRISNIISSVLHIQNYHNKSIFFCTFHFYYPLNKTDLEIMGASELFVTQLTWVWFHFVMFQSVSPKISACYICSSTYITGVISLSCNWPKIHKNFSTGFSITIIILNIILNANIIHSTHKYLKKFDHSQIKDQSTTF